MNQKEAVLKELNTISQKHKGMLRPADVVKFAKNKTTALHSCFTWDNTRAAEQWRLHEARNLIRVAVTVLSDEDETEYRAFVSLKTDRYAHMGYRPLITILTDDDLREVLMAEALEEMQVFKDKYHTLKELVGVFAEMDRVISRKKKTVPIRTKSGRKQVAVATA